MTDPPYFIDPVPGPPRVTATSPRVALPLADDRVSVDRPIDLSLDEPVYPRSVTGAAIRVLDVTGATPRPVSGRLALVQDATSARISFAAYPALPENAVIEVRVESP